MGGHADAPGSWFLFWPPQMTLEQHAGAPGHRLPDRLLQASIALLLYRGHDDMACAREALSVHWPPYAEADGTAAFVRQIRSLNVNDTLAIADQLPHLALPARVVWGAADQFLKLHYGERLARDLRAPLERIEGGKHFVPEDHAATVADAIDQLITR
jgi:pimeloyl-ACP methyl ester carboxylesterase